MASERLPHGRVVPGEGGAGPHARADRTNLRDVSATGSTRRIVLPEIDPGPASGDAAEEAAAALEAERADERAVERAAERENAPKRGKFVSHLVTALIALVLLGVIVVLLLAVLIQQGVFAVSAIHAADTEHLAGDDIASLASVSSDTSLFTVDEASISENLMRNPWVGSVRIVREFPSTLRIEVTERVPRAVVLMSSGDRAWLLADDNHWIEPLVIDGSNGAVSGRDVAYQKAQEMGCLFIENVPVSMVPTSGTEATDGVLDAVWLYYQELSEDFRKQIISFSAPSENAISCTLNSGVEVSLGSPVDISEKEAVARAILDEHPNDVTYVNVRLPSKPTYRKVGLPSGHEGTPISYSEDPTAPAQQEGAVHSQQEGANGSGANGSGTGTGQQGSDASYGSDGSGAGSSTDSGANAGSGTASQEREPMFVNDETGELFYDYESYIASL